MRLYSASSEETLRARKLLADWAEEGYITQAQHERFEQETVSNLRTTNIFLRLVLFLFTLICVGAAIGLFFVVSRPSDETAGVFLLILAAGCYAAAEATASQAHFYRYGIEEAFAVCSVAFLCVGMLVAFFSGGHYSPGPNSSELLVPAIGAMFSLWIWHRFGYSYAFIAAMVFAVFLPGYWTSSHAAQHVITAFLYLVGLICIVAARHDHRFDYLDERYSFAE